MYTNDSLSYINNHQEYTTRDIPVKQSPQRRAFYPMSISNWPTPKIPEASMRMGPITGSIGESWPLVVPFDEHAFLCPPGR